MGWSVGDSVCALVPGGGYAEYCTTPSVQCLPIPKDMDFVHAAAIPETTFTVWTNLFERGRLAKGETVLVHGGTSGIGTTAIQLARAFGAHVFATAGSQAKCAACRALGAERAFNYHETDFVAAVREATGGRGVDVVLDIVGGDYLQRNLEASGRRGTISHDRAAGRMEIAGEHDADLSQAAHDYGLDVAAPPCRRKGSDRESSSWARVAAL